MSVQAWMRKPENRQLVARFLRETGLDGTDTEVDQLGIMLEAVETMEDRERKYGDQWRKSGCIDNLMNARRKVARQLVVADHSSKPDYSIENVTVMPGVAVEPGSDDDAIDTLNYVTFAIRNMRNLNFDGDWSS